MSNNFKTFLDLLYKNKELNSFFEDAKNSNIFYFNPVESKIKVKDIDINTEINMPFKNCWLESYDIDCISTIKDIEGNLSFIDGIYVDEIIPNKYIFLVLINNYSKNNPRVFIGFENDDNHSMEAYYYKICSAIVEDFLTQLNTKIIKEHSNKNKYKGFNPKSKKGFHINNVIIITNILRKSTEGKKHLEKNKCEYRFEVRGHWRAVDGIGKDRQGEYNVQGFTWVKPCIKGSENLPFVPKIRKIKS